MYVPGVGTSGTSNSSEYSGLNFPTSRTTTLMRVIFLSPSPSALVLFCSDQSERLRVKFDGLHAALEHAADQRPGLTFGDQVEKPFFLFRRPAHPRHDTITS